MVDFRPFEARNRPIGHQLVDLVTNTTEQCLVGAMLQSVRDPVRHVDRVRGVAAAGGHGRGADADPGGDEGRALLVGYGVLVDGNTSPPEDRFCLLAGVVAIREVEQHQVVVGAAGDEVEAPIHEHARHHLGIGEHLLLVDLESRLERLVERHRLAGDDVHERTTLGTREDRRVVGLDPLAAASEAETTTRTPQGLVCGGRDVVAVLERRRMQPSGDQPRNVSHVVDQDGTDLVGNGPEAGKVPGARIGGSTGHDELRALAQGDRADLVHVDVAGLVDAVVDGPVELAGAVGGGSMGEVSPIREVQPHQRVARLEGGEVQRQVGVGTGVRLHVYPPVGVGQTEQLKGAGAGQLLDLVDDLAAAVVALTGETLSVLVGEHAADDREHARRDVVLRSDELEVVALALFFRRDQRSNGRISDQVTHERSM